jgi:hypothetical protein
MQRSTQRPISPPLVSPRADLVALVSAIVFLALLGAAACADDGVPVETESASTTAGTSTSQAASDTQSGSVSETSAVPAGWPQDWYGDYYEDPGFTLGLEYQIPSLIPGGLKNMRLGTSEATLERFGYEVDAGEDQWTYSVERDGDVLRLLPPAGSSDAPYSGVDALLGPGAGCDEVVLEVRNPEPLYSTRWRRGSLCVIDPYDEPIANDKWMVDLCAGSVSSCDGG